MNDSLFLLVVVMNYLISFLLNFNWLSNKLSELNIKYIISPFYILAGPIWSGDIVDYEYAREFMKELES